MTRIHQAYGRNYQLPNTTAHNETCANIGNVLWNWRMFLVSGEARYIDVLELALYNSVLSGVSLEGSDYFYTNPLRVTDPLPVALRWSRKRVPFVTSYCCPPNVVRTVAQVNGYAYAKSSNSLWVNLYGTSKVTTELSGEKVTLTQTTDYPWDGEIQLKIGEAGDKPFTVKLRVPGWAERADVKLNGEIHSAVAAPGTYVEINRTWKANDVVELEFPMPAQLIESHPLVEETRNEVAVKRGPIVYCLESDDLPKEVRLSDIRLSSTMTLHSSYEANLLGGIGTLEGNVSVHDSGAWDGKLYRPLAPRVNRSISVKFVPYYAWGNRDAREMSVWLPLD